MSDDRWEPGDYEPDLTGGYRNAPPSALSDRVNCWLFYATEQFHSNMSEYEVSIGRELTATEKYRHTQRFEGMLAREYGASRPDPAWLSRHDAWHRRGLGRGGAES